MIGRLKELMFGRNGKQFITVSVCADFTARFDSINTSGFIQGNEP